MTTRSARRPVAASKTRSAYFHARGEPQASWSLEEASSHLWEGRRARVHASAWAGSKAQRAPLEILLVDDDRSFGAILKRSATRNGLNMTICHDLDSLGAQMHNSFDVAVVDYDLGSVTGIEICDYLETRTWSTPFVLISQSELPRDAAHNPAMWNFIHKERGFDAIIAAVYAARATDLADRRRHPLRRSAR